MYNETMLAMGAAPSAIRELYAYGLERKAQIGDDKVFDFSIGNPSVPTPAKVTQTLQELLENTPAQDLHGYTPSAGAPNVRLAIAESLNRRFGTDYGAANVYMTCGAAASISITLKALIEPGDEVIVISPFFPEYRTWIETHGAKLVMVQARESDFQIDAPALAAAINAHTKAVIINSPNNPVGVVYSEDNLKELAHVLEEASEKNGSPVFLVSDEPYRELAYGGSTVPWVPDIYDDTIVCYSWSKSFSLPGERIGYILVPGGVRDSQTVFTAVSGAGRALGFVCAPAIFQQAVARCVDEKSDTAAYERNRELLCAIMDECGFTYIQPQGAFYLWVKALEPDAQAFSGRAKAHELLIVPSDSFGVKGWVRLGYCVSEQTITGSAEAFRALRDEYR